MYSSVNEGKATRSGLLPTRTELVLLPEKVTKAALPLLEQSENPVVVNVSSALGSFWAVTNPDRR